MKLKIDLFLELFKAYNVYFYQDYTNIMFEDKDGNVRMLRDEDIDRIFASSVVLTGEAALSFANSLFRPTREETERCNAVMEKIDSDITITEHEDCFSADVSWLDLSFFESEVSLTE